MAGVIVLTSSSVLMILLLIHLFETCVANCPPSSCGVFHNISYPFRLKDDPKHCGERRAELACEKNVTFFYLNSHKYYVKAISNHSQELPEFDFPTIRVVDASIKINDTCSFPTYSLYPGSFSTDDYYIQFGDSWPIYFMSCPQALKINSSVLNLVETTHDCASSNSSSHSHPRFTYIRVGGSMKVSDLTDMCTVDMIVMASMSWETYLFENVSVSLSDIHDSLLNGFELMFCRGCKTTNWGKNGSYIYICVKFALN
ncbi:hypothetical protein C2S53_011326 [Perilla frutescens var. hirtella]|uniref:Wall-associated receptor kinase galacturonan-binding domain-containing protein n=1 Tax=Perilla frutescens var. hirtella TaxID=608512 RepID=A0AAD4IX31_PERFH|nr:hypothetical protein C2S53_011326 [Perilla frutescens var. hirtella]